MIINHNIAALNTHRQLGTNNAMASKNLEKLSSGLKINRAGDDAAGLAISEKMRAQIRGLDMAQKNSQDAISLIQTAEGALNETHSILQRMRELAVQAGNDTNVESDREEIQKEINQLTSEINRIGNTTEFNTKKLTNGELSSESVVTPAVPGTPTETVKAITQDIAVGDNPVTWTGDAQAKTDITFAGAAENGFDWADIDTAETNALTLTKTDGEITVTFAGQDGAGATLAINAEALAFDETAGTYSYSNHGISFTLTEEQVNGWTEGDSATIDLNVVGSDLTAAAVNTDSGIQPLNSTVADPTTETGAAITGFKVDGDSNQVLAGVSNVDVAWDSAGGELTVALKDADGTDVSTTTFSWDGTTAFSYAANGIEFTLEANDATDITGNFDLQTVATTAEVGGTAAVTEDKSAQFQIGANEHQSMSVGINDMRAAALGITGTGEGFTAANAVTNGTNSEEVESAVDVSTHANAAKAVTTINDAIEKVSAERSKLGAVQNRLEHTINNLGTSSENLTAAESRIRDVDYVLTAA